MQPWSTGLRVTPDVGDVVAWIVGTTDACGRHVLRYPRLMQVESGHERKDLRTRREPVVPIPFGWVDRFPGDAPRHLEQLEVDAAPCRGGRVRRCEQVVWERQQAESLVGLIARGAEGAHAIRGCGEGGTG